ncbi:MAG: Cof-type HAD-IIB family hydrolase [Desulfosporosinus sp.]|nr:Cof-type HAD-IIB family hydrolase [Desulfosporosinus sp.]
MNKSQAGILLVCDMDGTLLNSHNQISPQNRSALNRFVAQGGSFTVATGRIEASVEQYLTELPINAPAILYNGAMIYDFHQRGVIWTSLLPVQITGVIKLILGNFPGIGVEIYQNGKIYLLAENDLTTKHEEKENIAFIRSLSIEQLPNPWQKVLLAWDPPKISRVESFLNGENPPLVFVRSEPYFLEILPQGVNKGFALGYLTKYLGIPHSKVVAMGDNLNDREMLQIAGYGIAVANAHVDLKAIATFCSCYNDQHAVAKVVDWIEQKMPK